MTEKWTDHLEILTKKLFPNLENFRRDDPFSYYRETWSYFSEYVKSFERSKVHKSLAISLDYLRRGNLVFKPTFDRISCYTQSIFYAPDNSPPLIIAYLKRSELLLETGHAKESGNDSEMAFECFINSINKSPAEIMRMYKATEMEMLGKVVEGNLREMMVPEGDIPYVGRKILSLLKRHLSSGSLDVAIKSDEFSLPGLRYGENVNFPSSSNGLRVEYSRAKGRHVIANCDIRMGDILFVEEPFSFVVHKARCSHCCQSRYAYLPCTNCRDVQYCSKVCRDEDWESCHKYECGFVDLLKQTGIGFLALKTLLKAESDIDKLRNLVRRLKARETFSNTVFSNLKYENVYNLLNHSESIPTADFFHYSLTALLLSFYLMNCTQYAVETEEDAFFCAEILLRHIIQLVTNAHAITSTETEVDENCATFATEEEQIGSGIYPSVSIMNHSCYPSVFITFRKSYIIVKAARDIKQGEEVFNSYGVDCRRMNRTDRQELLRAQYLFDCNCVPCTEVYDRNDILNSFKCRRCVGPLVKEEEMDESERPGDRACLICSHHQTIPDALLSLDYYISGVLSLGEATLKENKVKEALTIYLKGWRLARDFFFAYHIHTSSLARQISLCFYRLKNYARCMEVLSYNVICVEGRFGPYSPELAIEAKNLMDVINHYCRHVQETRPVPATDILTYTEKEYFRMCQKILRALYGDDHPVVGEDILNETIPDYTGITRGGAVAALPSILVKIPRLQCVKEAAYLKTNFEKALALLRGLNEKDRSIKDPRYFYSEVGKVTLDIYSARTS